MRCVFLALLLILLVVPVSAQDNEQVSPYSILKQCTETSQTCLQAQTTCDTMLTTVDSLIAWKGILFVVITGLMILATWFIVFSLLAIYRWINDMMKRSQKARYVDQLEHTNKLLMETIEKLKKNFDSLSLENQKLQESRSILRELLDKQLPQIHEAKVEEKALDMQKLMKMLRTAGLIVIGLVIIMVILFLLYHFGIIDAFVIKLPALGNT